MHKYKSAQIGELFSIMTGVIHGVDINNNHYESWFDVYSELSKLLDKQLENDEENTELETEINYFKNKFAPPYQTEELGGYIVEELLSNYDAMKDFINEFNDLYLGYNVLVDSRKDFLGRQKTDYQFELKVSDEKVREYRDFYKDALKNDLNNERIYHANRNFIENLTKDSHVSLDRIHRAFRYYSDNVRLTVVDDYVNNTLSFTWLKELGRSVILEMYLHAGKLIEGYEEAVAPGESLTPEELEIENTPYSYPERKDIEREAREQLINKYPKLQSILTEHLTQEVRPQEFRPMVFRTNLNTSGLTNNRGGFPFWN